MRSLFAALLLLTALSMQPAEEEKPIHLEAKTQHWVEDLYWEGAGSVKLTYEDIRVEADLVKLDWQNKIVTAEGRVIMTQKKSRLTADRMVFNLEDKTGTFEKATGTFGDMYSFAGKKITKLSEKKYTMEKGLFTSCDLDHPPWSFTVHKATVEMEGYAHMTSIALKIHKVPVIYFPYLLWPAKTGRARGLLTPHLGYTNNRGFHLGLAYFLPFGPSYDLTVMEDYYAGGYLGGGLRFRYNPTTSIKGKGVGYLIKDDEGTHWWKIKWRHDQSNLPLGFKLNADLEFLSDINFFREFERAFDRNTNRYTYSHMTLTKNWGLNSLIIRADRRKTTFASSSHEIVLNQLPETEYRLRTYPLIKGRIPLYLDLESRLHFFSVDKSENYRGSYGRADLFPTLSTSISTIPWLSVRPSVGVRATYYSKTLDDQQALKGPSYTRSYQIFQTEVVGPMFSRIWTGKKRSFKHLIEPRLTYQNLFNLEDKSLPIFDENDSIRPKNQIRYALVNRLYMKSGKTSAREIASLEISQDYNFNKNHPLTTLTKEGKTEKSQRGKLNVALRFYPGSHFNLDSRLTFHAITHQWDSLQLSGGVRFGSQYVNFTYFRTHPPIPTYPKQHQIRIYSGFKFLTHWDLKAQVNYDMEKHYPPQQRYLITYTGSCYAIGLEYRDYRLGTSKDREYKISFDLKNVGSFIEITGGVDDLFGGPQ